VDKQDSTDFVKLRSG